MSGNVLWMDMVRVLVRSPAKHEKERLRDGGCSIAARGWEDGGGAHRAG